MGHSRGNYKYGGGSPCKILKAYHVEDGVENHRQYMGNTGGRRGVEGIWNVERGHIHFLQAGDSGAVDGSKKNLWRLCTGEMVQGVGMAEETVVDTRGAGGDYLVRAGGFLAGSISDAYTAGKPSGRDR